MGIGLGNMNSSDNNEDHSLCPKCRSNSLFDGSLGGSRVFYCGTCRITWRPSSDYYWDSKGERHSLSLKKMNKEAKLAKLKADVQALWQGTPQMNKIQIVIFVDPNSRHTLDLLDKYLTEGYRTVSITAGSVAVCSSYVNSSPVYGQFAFLLEKDKD